MGRKKLGWGCVKAGREEGIGCELASGASEGLRAVAT